MFRHWHLKNWIGNLGQTKVRHLSFTYLSKNLLIQQWCIVICNFNASLHCNKQLLISWNDGDKPACWLMGGGGGGGIKRGFTSIHIELLYIALECVIIFHQGYLVKFSKYFVACGLYDSK